MLTGVGDTSRDRARSIAEMRREGCEQVRVMSFVPQMGTPLAATTSPRDEAELLSIAVLRLAMPERFIPASLDVAGIDGLERRLQAGANVVTSLVPPGSGFLGVSQAELGIDEGERSVASVVPRLTGPGPASPAPSRSTAIAWPRCARARDEWLREAARPRRQAAGHRGRVPGREGRVRDAPGGSLAGAARGRPRRSARRRRHHGRRESEPRRWQGRATPSSRPARTRRPSNGSPSVRLIGACRCSSTWPLGGSRGPSEPPGASSRAWASRGPSPWPACGFPVVVKPDGASGSHGVSMAARRGRADGGERGAGRRRPRGRRRGVPERAVALARGPRVERPWSAPPGHRARVRQRPRLQARGGAGRRGRGRRACGRRPGQAGLARGHRLVPGLGAGRGARRPCPLRRDERAPRRGPGAERRHGRRGRGRVTALEPRVLEIDARLPSQTPTAVYWSSGLNLVELLVETARRGALPAVSGSARRACVYQHVSARDGRLEVVGEHALGAGPSAASSAGVFRGGRGAHRSGAGGRDVGSHPDHDGRRRRRGARPRRARHPGARPGRRPRATAGERSWDARLR